MTEAKPQMQPRRRIGSQADPRRVAEGYEAAVTDEQVQTCGEDGRDEDLARKVEVEISTEQRKRGQCEAQHNPYRQGASRHPPGLLMPSNPVESSPRLRGQPERISSRARILADRLTWLPVQTGLADERQ